MKLLLPLLLLLTGCATSTWSVPAHKCVRYRTILIPRSKGVRYKPKTVCIKYSKELYIRNCKGTQYVLVEVE